MSRLASIILAAATAGTLLGVQVAALSTSAAATGPNSTPAPTITGNTTTSGIQLRGRQSKKSRLDVGTPVGTPHRKKTTGTPSLHRPEMSSVTTASSTRRKTTRLNIGMCGREQNDGTIPGPTRCQPYQPDRPQQPEKPTQTAVTRQRIPQPQEVTWEQVLTESKDVLFPALTVKVQPRERTLVNLDTIVYTDDNGVTANWVRVLGFPVLVEATPVKYLWTFGDGSRLATLKAGRPYPAKDITHKYMKRGSVGLTVTVIYTARFFVGGAGWRTVAGTIPVTGPVTPLLVREAVPVLVGPGG
ncbi:hypothetical protein AB0E69_16185 [Kribbella sp. NPDC026611]|uniref:PKD domain-containing protein n=1 Tax=Kribbella sp. NPDC026611 TaxID=3154911 RepID=UPI0033FCAE63